MVNERCEDEIAAIPLPWVKEVLENEIRYKARCSSGMYWTAGVYHKGWYLMISPDEEATIAVDVSKRSWSEMSGWDLDIISRLRDYALEEPESPVPAAILKVLC
jgi:hypothetical protein